jgi:phosphatidylinositol alpha-1,6-mannosyltransferase
LVEGKNVASVIKAISLLPDTLLEYYRYVVVGNGPQMSYLEALSKDLRLDNVDFTGEVEDREKVSQLLGQSKLFVLCPKSYMGDFEIAEEGFGISFIEAQAAGIPVIGSNIGGIPEAVGNGGLLVENPADPEEIASRIQVLLEDTSLYERLRRNARARIPQFDRKAAVKKFERLYQESFDAI